MIDDEDDHSSGESMSSYNGKCLYFVLNTHLIFRSPNNFQQVTLKKHLSSCNFARKGVVLLERGNALSKLINLFFGDTAPICINPFAPERPVATHADPGPFYHL